MAEPEPAEKTLGERSASLVDNVPNNEVVLFIDPVPLKLEGAVDPAVPPNGNGLDFGTPLSKRC